MYIHLILAMRFLAVIAFTAGTLAGATNVEVDALGLPKSFEDNFYPAIMNDRIDQFADYLQDDCDARTERLLVVNAISDSCLFSHLLKTFYIPKDIPIEQDLEEIPRAAIHY